VRALAGEDAPGDEAARAPGLDRLVGGLEQYRQLGFAEERARLEQARERIPLETDLLPREEQETRVDRRLGLLGGEPARELDHHGDAALHVRRAEADDP